MSDPPLSDLPHSPRTLDSKSQSVLSQVVAGRVCQLTGLVSNNRSDPDLEHEIDLDLNELSQATRKLAYLRNKLRPISRLHDDVLSLIFTFVATASPPRNRKEHLVRGTIGWIAQVTYVCRYWRKLGLGLAKLWANDVTEFPSPAVLETMLAHAKQAPLTLRLDRAGGDEHFSCIDSFSHAHLTEAGTFAFKNTVTFVNGRNWLTMPSEQLLPRLEHLRIERQGSQQEGVVVDKPICAPNLKTVSFWRAFVPWTPGPSLIALSLRTDNPPLDRRLLTSQALIDILRQSPLLEMLTLESSVTGEIPHAKSKSSLGPVVSLSRLQRITLEDSTPRFRALWGYISAPITAGVQLCFTQLTRGEPVDKASHPLSAIRTYADKVIRDGIAFNTFSVLSDPLSDLNNIIRLSIILPSADSSENSEQKVGLHPLQPYISVRIDDNSYTIPPRLPVLLSTLASTEAITTLDIGHPFKVKLFEALERTVEALRLTGPQSYVTAGLLGLHDEDGAPKWPRLRVLTLRSSGRALSAERWLPDLLLKVVSVRMRAGNGSGRLERVELVQWMWETRMGDGMEVEGMERVREMVKVVERSR